MSVQSAAYFSFVKSVTCAFWVYFTFLKLVLKPRRLFFEGIKIQTSFFF